jgi:hypothetical protein
MCLSILGVTVYEKFGQGGYVTIGVTGAFVAVCFATRRYYDSVNERVRKLNQALTEVPTRPEDLNTSEPNPQLPSAVMLVGGYSGLGVHTMLNALKFTPGHFRNLVFVNVSVVDSGNFKGEGAVSNLRKHTEQVLAKYVDPVNRLG